MQLAEPLTRKHIFGADPALPQIPLQKSLKIVLRTSRKGEGRMPRLRRYGQPAPPCPDQQRRAQPRTCPQHGPRGTAFRPCAFRQAVSGHQPGVFSCRGEGGQSRRGKIIAQQAATQAEPLPRHGQVQLQGPVGQPAPFGGHRSRQGQGQHILGTELQVQAVLQGPQHSFRIPQTGRRHPGHALQAQLAVLHKKTAESGVGAADVGRQDALSGHQRRGPPAWDPSSILRTMPVVLQPGVKAARNTRPPAARTTSAPTTAASV